jgi:hypothetical protein
MPRPPWRWAALAVAAVGSLAALGGQAAVTAATRDDPLRTPFWFAHVAFQGVALGLAGAALARPASAAVPAVAFLACLVVLQFAFEAAGTLALLPSPSSWAAVIGELWYRRRVVAGRARQEREKKLLWPVRRRWKNDGRALASSFVRRPPRRAVAGPGGRTPQTTSQTPPHTTGPAPRTQNWDARARRTRF